MADGVRSVDSYNAGKWMWGGIVDGVIRVSLSGNDFGGSWVNTKSINLSPFKKIRFTARIYGSNNPDHYLKVGLRIRDVNKNIIKNPYDNNQWDHFWTGYTLTREFDISGVNQQAFIEVQHGGKFNIRLYVDYQKIEFLT